MNDYSCFNAQNVLENLNALIADCPKDGYKTDDVYKRLSIFDWWVNTICLNRLKEMRSFLNEAIKLGYTGYVCFKVGAKYCANGMWAYKDESTDGYSPKNSAFLYRSFTPDYTCWQLCGSDGTIYPTGQDWNSIKTIKRLEAVIDSARKIQAALS